MTFITELTGLGVSPEKAQALGIDTIASSPSRSSATGLTATGSAIGDALQLTAFHSVITTTPLSTGVKLSPLFPVGQLGIVDNRGANPLNLFPPSATERINGGTLGAAVTIAAAAVNLVVRVSSTDFVVCVLAKEA